MARNFDGVDDLIDFGTCGDSFMRENQACTIIVWGYTRGTNSSSLVRRLSTNQVSFIINSTTAGKLRFVVGAATNLDVVSSTNVTNNKWQSYAVTWGGDYTQASSVHIYIDSVEVSYGTQTNGSGALGDNSTAALTVGNNQALTSDYDGILAHVQIFTRVLSASEIKQASYFPGSITNGLAFYAPLWGGSPEPDYSGNRNNGTVTGATVSSNNPPINGVFHPQRPNLYYSSFSSGVAPTSGTSKINRMMLMGVS